MFRNFSQIRHEAYNYVYLAVCNIGSVLLTNIASYQTKVSFIYIEKAAEPIFALMLAYAILGQRYDYRIMLTMIQVSLGVYFTIMGSSNMQYIPYKIEATEVAYGFMAIFCGSFATASRTLFYKIHFTEYAASNPDQSKIKNTISFYSNISFVSFLGKEK